MHTLFSEGYRSCVFLGHTFLNTEIFFMKIGMKVMHPQSTF